MKYKAIIFDLDGVICHTDQYHYLAWKRLADQLGIYFDETINNRLRGVSRMDSLRIILEQNNGEILSEERMVELTEEKNRQYQMLLAEMSPKDLSKEVKDTLEALRKMGLKIAIGSSSKNTKIILKQIGLENYFDAISDGNNIINSKPNPEVFIKAAQFLLLSTNDCLVVEDAKAGIDAACAAGMDCAGIGDAYGYDKATYHLKSFSDIITYL